mmetsp:Transcript_11161/g.20211  ORF Transcript_11161/g.20211 Transcript_11161/m.20211 type:complete len:251 (-) Transcript_11161:309-1061(-)
MKPGKFTVRMNCVPRTTLQAYSSLVSPNPALHLHDRLAGLLLRLLVGRPRRYLDVDGRERLVAAGAVFLLPREGREVVADQPEGARVQLHLVLALLDIRHGALADAHSLDHLHQVLDENELRLQTLRSVHSHQGQEETRFPGLRRRGHLVIELLNLVQNLVRVEEAVFETLKRFSNVVLLFLAVVVGQDIRDVDDLLIKILNTSSSSTTLISIHSHHNARHTLTYESRERVVRLSACVCVRVGCTVGHHK